jgi:hypothetical protein
MRIIGHRWRCVSVLFIRSATQKTQTQMNLGRLNFRLTRVQSHLSKVQWLMLTYIFLDNLKVRYGVSFWWIFLIIPVILIVAWIDKKWIYPNESDASALGVPYNISMMEKMDKIIKHFKL